MWIGGAGPTRTRWFLRLCVLLSLVELCGAMPWRTARTGRETWWLLRRDCEREIFALTLMCFRAGVLAAQEWSSHSPAQGQTHRESYNSVGRVLQFAAGVKEIIHILSSSKEKCRS